MSKPPVDMQALLANIITRLTEVKDTEDLSRALASVGNGTVSSIDFSNNMRNRSAGFREKFFHIKSEFSKVPIETILEEARKGNLKSQITAGQRYYFDNKYDESYKWYLKASENTSKDDEIHKRHRAMACYMLSGFFKLRLVEEATRETKEENTKKEIEYLIKAASPSLLNETHDIAITLAQYFLACQFSEVPIKISQLWSNEALKCGSDKLGEYALYSALGILHSNGCKDIPVDRAKAIENFRKATKTEHKNAYARLACYYIRRFDEISHDPKEIFDYCKNLSRKKFTAPLGVCYLKGIGVSKDPKKAFDILSKAIIQDEKNSIWRFSHAYLLSSELELSQNASAMPLNTPVRKTDIILSDLKQKLEEEVKNVSDDVSARDLIINILFDYYEKINDVNQLVQLARQFEKLYPVRCLAVLGRSYLYGGEGVAKDIPKALEYYNLAAEIKNPYALCSLGEFHLFGSYGCRKKQAKAIQYFREAMEVGSTRALTFMGMCHLFGMGVNENIPKALEYFKRAEHFDCPIALECLAECYERGDTPLGQDTKRAFHYYEKSYSIGNDRSAERLAYYYLNGLSCAQNPEKGFEILSKLNPKTSTVQYILGHCYEYGLGTTKDKKQAFYCYNLAAKENIAARYRRAVFYKQDIDGKGADNNKALSEFQILVDELPDYPSYVRKTERCISEYDFNTIMAEVWWELAQLTPEDDEELIISRLEKSRSFGHEAAARFLIGIHLKNNGLGEVFSAKVESMFESIKIVKNGKLDSIKNPEDQLKLKKNNQEYYSQFLCFPSKFGRLLDTNHNLTSLETILHLTYAKIRDVQLPIAREAALNLTHFQDADKVFNFAKQCIIKIENIAKNLIEKYRIFEVDITRIYKTHTESIGEYINILESERKLYEDGLKMVKEQCDILADIGEKIEQDLKSLILNNKPGAQLIPATKNAVTQEKSNTTTDNKNTLEKEREEQEQKAKLDKRNAEREQWKSITKEHHKQFLQKHRKTAKNKLSHSLKEYIQSDDALIERKKDNERRCLFTPSARTLAKDWQIPERLRFKEESDLLAEVTGFLQKLEGKEVRLKLSLEDLWVERELLVNLLGRLMEVTKNFEGKELKFPIDGATHIRNVLLKYPYFEPVPEGQSVPETVLNNILETNNNLRCSIRNILDFFNNHSKMNNIPKTFKELSPILEDSLLNDIVEKAGTDAFTKQNWTLSQCHEKMDREVKNLNRLNRYKGILADDYFIEIVKRCCEARMGTVSSYVKANVKKLFPNGIETYHPSYRFLVREDSINSGNDFRHAKTPLLFSTPSSSEMATTAVIKPGPIPGPIKDTSLIRTVANTTIPNHSSKETAVASREPLQSGGTAVDNTASQLGSEKKAAKKKKLKKKKK